MHFRKYIYNDDIDSDIKNNELLTMELFGLGDLYSLPRLKAQIEAEMKETLSVKIEEVSSQLIAGASGSKNFI